MLSGILFLILLLTSTSVAGAQVENVTFGRPLEGRLELSERLAPLGAEFKAGSIFSRVLLPLPRKGNLWVKIPSWIAGTWVQRESTSLFRRDERTGQEETTPCTRKAVSSMRWGWQKDAKGDIWHYLSTRGINRTQGQAATIYGIRRDGKPELLSDGQVLNRVYLVTVYVDPLNNRILKSMQQEQLESIKPTGEDAADYSSSVRAYDAEGNPYRTWYTVSKIKRADGFHPLSYYRGVDTKELLVRYLKDNNLPDLIP